ncbi:MFS transporter [Sphingomonas sp. LaA6.9]|uniref:MFS transporter n=1 Tax=Sphingomonas sp. LaA6.9 TaxID=2919914 RepID=UPI001F4FD869|nr:MFS transporter [Sphingomonas sp. LaA6.9]MCJ8157391.1 MFS transporter [Sphingomonas sp. LaA6.9]
MKMTDMEWRRGWHVVLGAFLGLASGPLIYQHISSIFMLEMVREFGWSRSQVSSIMGMVAVGAVTAPITGYVVDRVGAKPVIFAGTIGLAIAYMLYAILPSSIGNYRLVVALSAVSGVACSALTYTRTVNAWFDKQRGTALAIAATGVAVSGLVMPLVLRQVIDAEGWRGGYVLLSTLVWVVGLPAIFLMFARPQPERNRLQPVRPAQREPWRAMFRLPAFWLIFGAMMFVHIPAVGTLSHFVPVMVSKGFNEDQAALLLSLYSFSVLIGRLCVGYFLDRTNPHYVAFVITMSGAIGILALLAIPLPGIALAACVTMLLGVQMGAELDFLPYFVSRHMTLRIYASVYGIMTSSILLSAGIAVQTYGLLYDLNGNYTVALIVGAIFFAMGALAFLMLGRVPLATNEAIPDEGEPPPVGERALAEG